MFFYGLLLSLIFIYFILPKKSGYYPNIKINFKPLMFNSMIIIPINRNYALHIHHWFIYFFVLFASFFIYIPKLITGFSLGLFLQGISYSDSFNFLCKNPY